MGQAEERTLYALYANLYVLFVRRLVLTAG